MSVDDTFSPADIMSTRFNILLEDFPFEAINDDHGRMTFWSRHDPIRQAKGNTDHWAKYRQKSGNVRIRFGSAGPVSSPVEEEATAAYWNNESARLNYVQNRFIPLKQRKFDDLVLDGLRGNPPGNYMNSRPRNSFNRNVYSNSYHDRAIEGFRYWLIERPKPTKFGKINIGAYKSVLGFGNAPRT